MEHGSIVVLCGLPCLHPDDSHITIGKLKYSHGSVYQFMEMHQSVSDSKNLAPLAL